MSDRRGPTREALLALPSAGLGTWPTPLHRLDRFGAAIGAEVWIKRDDVQGVALAGNKIRKFNLVIGQAMADGCDTLVTTGAIQSNSARTGASAAAATGMDCHLVLSGEPPDTAEGGPGPTANLLLDHLVGATIHHAVDASWVELNQQVDDLVAELNAAGRRAFAAPIGCSSPLGSLGFARALLELEAQLAIADVTPSAIVHTTTSGGTHAGLLVGRALMAPDSRLAGVPIIGVDAGRLYDDVAAQHWALAVEAAALIGLDLAADLSGDVTLVHDQVGDAYGAHTEASTEAIELLARTEAVIVDPVYSAKGLAGLIALVRSGDLGDSDSRDPIVFWHTGGYHALFDPHHGSPLVRHRH
ncbi:MAG: pyridoxal-phosphate dependent enzyme [Acidimicrobiia bacterium]|nr:pyridoxal-phosphate dependent enzyme [Acidimicrobiia bacterium]